MRRIFIFLKVFVLLFLIVSRVFNLSGLNAYLEEHLLLGGIFNVVIYLISIELLRSFILFLYRKQKKIKYPNKDNFILGIQNLFVLFYIIGLGYLLLKVANVELSSFIFSVSLVAAALAIISKEFIADILSSMLITFSRELEVGDVIKIADNKGKILDMSLTKTTILTEDDDVIYIPNSKVYLSEIINYTKREIKKTSVGFELPTGAVGDIKKLEQYLLESISDYKKFINEDSFNLRIVEIKKDYFSLKFQYILIIPDHELEKAIRKNVVRYIFNLVNQSKALNA